MNNDRLLNDEADAGAWLATRYALGEMTDAELEEFERRLLTDVAICDEVVSAVQMLSAVAMVEASTLSRRSDGGNSITVAPRSAPRSVRAHRTTTAIVAVSCAVVLLATFVMMSSGPSTPELALDAEGADVFLQLMAEDSGRSLAEDVSDETVFDDLAEELIAPEWLLTAIDLDEADGGKAESGAEPDDETELF